MDVKIFDDFLTSEELHFVTNFFHRYKGWEYGHNTCYGDRIKWFHTNLNENTYFSEHLRKKILKLTNFEWDSQYKVYANGQPTLLNGGWHTDISSIPLDSPEAEKCWTAILYVSDITPENIDKVNGHLELRINDEIRNIEPYKNRLVMFKSGILHRGLAPSDPEVFRISVAWKLKKK